MRRLERGHRNIRAQARALSDLKGAGQEARLQFGGVEATILSAEWFPAARHSHPDS